MRPVFIIIQPSDRRISCSLVLHIFTHEIEREKERKKERIWVRN
jgi:hypothetical protein